MCNPAYLMAVVNWKMQEDALADARKEARKQAVIAATLEVEAATQKQGQRLLAMSASQQNDFRKAVSAQGLAAVKMAGRGITGGTAFTGAVQNYVMRTSELAGSYAVKERQARAQYGGEIGSAKSALSQRVAASDAQFASTGMGGLMMQLATAAVTTYMATGDFGILSGAPAATPNLAPHAAPIGPPPTPMGGHSVMYPPLNPPAPPGMYMGSAVPNVSMPTMGQFDPEVLGQFDLGPSPMFEF